MPTHIPTAWAKTPAHPTWLSAKDHDPHVKGFFDHLVANGKTKMQGVCAVMRKLLHAIHGMFTHNQPFDNSRFYALPA